jgi:hypothetical protein
MLVPIHSLVCLVIADRGKCVILGPLFESGSRLGIHDTNAAVCRHPTSGGARESRELTVSVRVRVRAHGHELVFIKIYWPPEYGVDGYIVRYKDEQASTVRGAVKCQPTSTLRRRATTEREKLIILRTEY